jgi:uncharacterized protein (TIGR00266 family)
MPTHASTPQAPLAQLQNTSGQFDGGQLWYKIDHRDSNSVLSVMLQPGYEVNARPGSMVTMQASVQVKGHFKFSLKKIVTGDEMSESTFTGPGEVVFAPEIFGDIFPIAISPDQVKPWCIGKGSYLASTRGVTKSSKSQGLKKGFFSGDGLFIHEVIGNGILFVRSFGAVMEKELRPGEELIVDNGHLVAWNCPYKIERIQASGGFLSGIHTGEGLVCRFQGPGKILIQTRNPEALGEWVAAQVPSSGG